MPPRQENVFELAHYLPGSAPELAGFVDGMDRRDEYIWADHFRTESDLAYFLLRKLNVRTYGDLVGYSEAQLKNAGLRQDDHFNDISEVRMALTERNLSLECEAED